MASTGYRVSADIGGTFTDIVFQNSETGEVRALKVLSTPQNPALAVLEGVRKGLGEGEAVDFFVHGTTVGLNSVLTRRGAKVALLTTKNFRDVYTIQGNDRGEIFSIRWRKPEPLVTVEHTYTVDERIAADGTVDTPIDVSQLDELVEAVAEQGYDAIAVCFLFAFRNPEHELAAEAYLRERLPDIDIALSHKVSPEWREFDRISTTAMDAFTAPVVRRYLNTLVEQMSDTLPDGGKVHVMESNGGAMTADAAASKPLQTLLSGPVGGTIGGRALAAQTGRDNLICVDMGGTSFDASLIVDGLPSSSNETSLEGLPVQMSVVDIHVIGAGGGSIAWEEANALRVGPQSAGSVPGPACYGRGGTEPTVSDANLVLKRLDSSNFSGGEMTLDAEAARAAVKALGDRFGLGAEAFAQGIIDIINAKMADAIRTITVQRGIDPRDFALLAYGGAGPSQAAALAEQLDIREVIIPVHPGAFSAYGMLQTDMRHDFKRTYYGDWGAMSPDDLTATFKELEAEGFDHLRHEGMSADDISFERSVDLRYEGQEYVLTIPVDGGQVDPQAVRDRFDAAYQRQYGHSSKVNGAEVANLRVAALGRLKRPGLPSPAERTPSVETSRMVYFDGAEHETAVLQRVAYALGDRIHGPAIIEEETTTTLVPPGWHVEVIEGGHLSMKKSKTE
ncbi:hydantoinase/oxoprolinase family protein [Pelagovum pacificum]|uniref:Hydantoinase/oxoprolinase family protein n=1 Tax=Pelagovum pacificum TaxID=2588711 RepID=A0A5C5GH97_9RHOB|nr:hydantoinase/oxoprolinase family protein [Pelagovum pacificum]QQA43574.1 hydantoinase/oxoprolinase family protein [Pelagovum pacificum]TNY33289.1 hydantoinase/oxoprolinase family protein [Pelagovum pacificum]